MDSEPKGQRRPGCPFRLATNLRAAALASQFSCLHEILGELAFLGHCSRYTELETSNLVAIFERCHWFEWLFQSTDHLSQIYKGYVAPLRAR